MVRNGLTFSDDFRRTFAKVVVSDIVYLIAVKVGYVPFLDRVVFPFRWEFPFPLGQIT